MNYTGTSYRHEFYEQLRISLPVIFGNIFYRIPWLISLHMVGSIHPDTEFGSYELAAAALAQTLANVTGMSVGVGLSTALTTLAGQSHGAASFHSAKKDNDGSNDVHRDSENQQLSKPYSSSNYCSTTTYLFRGLFITLIFVFPIGLYWLHGIKPLLIWLGQGEKVSEMTQQYLRLLVPGLWGYSINWTLSAWFQAIGLSDIPTYFAMVIAILHYPFNLFYIYILDLGYIGAALATSTSQIVCPIMMISYMFCTKSGRRRLPLSTRLPTTLADSIIQSVSSIPGILQYLSLAFPGIVIISEWWASEVAVFLAGTLRPGPSFALDGMTIYQAINSFCFMLPVGCSVAGSARVSNLLGAKHPIGANIASNVSIISAAILSVCMGLTLWFVPHNYFPSFFDPDERVISETSLTVPFLSMYVIADGVQVALNGVIKGCGRQPIIMPIVVFAYWFVGLPLAYHFAFVLNKGTTLCDDRYLCGIAGLTAGMTVGTFTHCFLLCIVVLFNTDWALEEQRAQKRLNIDCCIEDESYEEMCILDIDNEKGRYESISATDNTNINTLDFIPVTESETASILSSSPSKAFASSGKLSKITR